MHVNSMKFSDSVVVCLWDWREVSACKLFYKIPPPEHKLTRQMSDRRMMSCIQTSHWNLASRRLSLCVWRKWISKKKFVFERKHKNFQCRVIFFFFFQWHWRFWHSELWILSSEIFYYGCIISEELVRWQ